MKTLYIPLTLLALVLGISLWGSYYTGARTEQWVSLLEEINTLAHQEQWEEANTAMKNAYQDWNSSRTLYSTIMKHEHLDEAETYFLAVITACEEQNSEDFHILLAQLIGQLQMLAQTQAVSVKNIL